MNEEQLEQENFQVVAAEDRIELIDKECRHQNAEIIARRPDGLVDCYCSQCCQGGIFKNLDEFKRS